MKDWIIRFYYNLPSSETAELASRILLLSLTGSVFFWVWKKMGSRLIKAGYEFACYAFLLLVPAGFLIPFTYWLMHWYGDQVSHYKPNFFYGASGSMTWTALGLVLIWICGMAVQLIHQIRLERKIRRKLANRMECGKTVRQIFEEQCRELKLKPGKVRLYQSYNTDIPRMMGLFRPVVILPVNDYSEEDLRVILTHELIHVSQKALWVRKLAQICLIIHWFNPTVWKCRKEIVRWTEYSCDASAAAKLKGLDYYHVIFRHAGGDSEYSLQVASLKEKECDILDRMKQAVGRQEVVKERRKLFSSAAVMVILCAGILGICAVAYAQTVERLSDATMVEVRIEQPERIMEKPVTVLYTDYGPAEDIVTVEGIVERTRDGSISANWTVANGSATYSTSTLNVVSGETISIQGFITPSNKTVKVGIQKVGGSRSYSEVSGIVDISIPISVTGTYKLFVENTSGVSVSATLEAAIE